MPRQTDSRRRMLDAAVRLFRSSGYHGTGLNRLVTEGGAPRGSLYFHFPGGKEQLAAEAMREATAAVGEQLARAATAAPDAAAAVGAMIDHLAGELAGSGYRCGCPLAGVALDAAPDSDLITAACAEGYRSWRDGIARLLTRHGAPIEPATALATVVLAAVEGALLLARIERDVDPLRRVRDHLVGAIHAATTSSAA